VTTGAWEPREVPGTAASQLWPESALLQFLLFCHKPTLLHARISDVALAVELLVNWHAAGSMPGSKTMAVVIDPGDRWLLIALHLAVLSRIPREEVGCRRDGLLTLEIHSSAESREIYALARGLQKRHQGPQELAQVCILTVQGDRVRCQLALGIIRCQAVEEMPVGPSLCLLEELS